MYSKVGAKDAELLVIGKKRISRKRKFFVCLLFAATVLTGMSVLEQLNAPAPTPVDTSVRIVSTMPKPLNGSPADYSAYENFCIAAGVINDASYFEADTEGTIVASVFGAPYNQTLEGHRVQKDGRLFHEINSTSTMKSVGEQRFFAQDTILMRTAKYKKGVPSWGNIGLVQTDDFSAKYGLIPREICLYVVNESTVLDCGFVSEEKGLKTYYLVLDPEAAPERYKRQVGTLGGASDYPVFKSIKLTFTIDSDWVIKSHTVEETYDISIAGLGAMTCRAVMTETFSNINANLDFPSAAQDFLLLAPDSVGDLDTAPVMTAADYLAEAFGGYLSGDAIKFSANVDALGLKLPLKGYLDIANTDIRISLGDILYAAYRDDVIYIKSGDGKIKIPVSSVTPVIEELKPLLNDLGVDLSKISSLLEGDVIGTLFSDSDITEDGNDVHILMPFSLMNIGFDVDMHIVKIGDKFAPKAINAVIDLKKLGIDKFVQTKDGEYKVKVKLDLTEEELPAPDGSFELFDISFAKDFIPTIENLISAKSYGITGSVNAGGTNVVLENAEIVRGDSLALSARVKVMGVTADIKLTDGIIYISAEGIKLKAAISELPALIDEITALIPNGEKTVSAIKEALGGIKSISLGAVLESALKFLPTLEYKDGVLGVNVILNETDVKLNVKPENDGISLSLPEFSVGKTEISAALSVTASAKDATPPTVTDAESYISASDLIPYLAPIKNLITAKSLKATLGGTVSGLGTESPLNSVSVGGNATVSLHDGTKKGLSMQAEFNVLSQKLGVCLKDGVAYVALNDGIKLSLDISKASLGELIQTVNGALPDDKKINGDASSAAIALADDILNLNFGSLIEFDEKTLTQFLGYILSLEYKNGALSLTLAIKDVTVTAEILTPTDGTSLSANVKINYAPLSKDGENARSPIDAQLSLTLYDFSENPADVEITDSENYVSSEVIRSVLSPVVSAVYAGSYNASGTLTVGKTEIGVKAEIVRGDSLSATATVEVMGVTADIKFMDNVIYLSAGNIKLKTTLKALPSIATEIVSLIPSGGEIMQTVNGLIKQIENLDLLEAVKKLSVTENNGGLRIAYGNITADVTPTGNDGFALALPELKISLGEKDGGDGEKTLALSASLNVTAKTECPSVTVDNPEKYVLISDVTPFIQPVMTIIGGKSLTAEITSGTVSYDDLNKYLDPATVASGLRGKIKLNYGKESGLSFQTVGLTAFTHAVDLAFVNGTAYVSINDNINLSLDVDDLSEILTQINGVLKDGEKIDAAKVTDYIRKIENLDLSSLVKFDEKTLAKLLGYVRGLEFKENRLIVILSINDVTVTASIATPENNSGKLDLSVSISYAPKAKNGEKAKAPLGVYLDLTLKDFSDKAAEITVADTEKYVPSDALVGFIQPVLTTVKQEKFDITFSGGIDKKNADGTVKKTVISGEIQIIPTTEITNASFPEMYLLLNIGDDKNPTQHALKILVEKPTDGEIELYANYNGMKIHLSYTQTLKIIDAVCGMLNLNIPVLNNLIPAELKSDLKTDLFADANVAGLTEMIDAVNDIFKVVESGKSAFDELINKVIYNALNDALRSITIEMQDGKLNVTVENSLLEHVMAIVNEKKSDSAADKQEEAQAADLGKAYISLSHGEALLKTLDISNLAVNGSVVKLGVELVDSANMTLPKSDGTDFANAMDFNSLYDLIEDVINTANTRYFPISGNLNLDLLGSKGNLSFKANIAIIDNPEYNENASAPKTKTLVGLKIESRPKLAARILLKETDRYLYFDGNYIYVQGAKSYYFTADKFGDYAMDILFDIIPFTDTAISIINSNMSGNGKDTAIDYGKVLTAYEKKGTKTSLTVNLGALSGKSILNDLKLNIVSKTIDSKNYLHTFDGSTSILGFVIQASFDAKLNSINQGITDRKDITMSLTDFNYSGDKMSDAELQKDLTKKIDSIAWETIESAFKK